MVVVVVVLEREASRLSSLLALNRAGLLGQRGGPARAAGTCGMRGKQLPSATSSRSVPSVLSAGGSSTSWLRETSRWVSRLARQMSTGTKGSWQQRSLRRCGVGWGGRLCVGVG